jgi:hypothetical protein
MHSLKHLAFISVIVLLAAAEHASSAKAQAITLPELDGAKIETTVVVDRTGRWNGEMVAGPLQTDRKITIDPGETLQATTILTATGPRGTATRQGTDTFTINKPREVQGLGGGSAVWIFAKGTLTFLRTYRSGAFKTEIAFHRSSAGLTCSIRSPFARENGNGEIEMNSLAGGTWQVISARTVSSGRRVTKR